MTPIMNKKEMIEWRNDAHEVDTIDEYGYDQNGNHEYTSVVEKEGRYYMVDMFNFEPCERWGDKGWVRGSYQFGEVKKKETARVVKEIDWEDINEEEELHL